MNGAGIHTWQLSRLSVFNWANSKTTISAISLYIFIRFDGITSAKIDDFDNFFKVGSPYVVERPRIRQLLSNSLNSSVCTLLIFRLIENEKLWRKEWFKK